MHDLTRRQSVAVSAAAWAAAAGPAKAQDQPTSRIADVFVVGRAGPLAQAIAERLGGAGRTARRIEPPALTEAAWQEALRTDGERPPAAIVNLCVADRAGAIGTVGLDDFRAAMDDGYVRTFLAMKYGIQALRAGGGGVFINVTSADGRTGAPGAAGRCAAANGVMQMTKCLALECAAKKDGVRVNAILAGAIAQAGAVGPGTTTPADLAETIAFLTGPGAVYLTGLLMPVHGGPRT